MKGDDPDDPRGLIREAYRMEIGLADARTIFLDWALGLPDGDGRAEIGRLLARYGEAADHPMTVVLREGLEPSPVARRRRR